MKYLAYYSTEKNKRNFSNAAVTKMQYISSTISSFEPVEIVSACGVNTKENNRGYCEKISNDISVKYFYSFGNRNIFAKLFEYLFKQIQLFNYLLFTAKKNNKILVYHSLGYMNVVKTIKKLKNINLILEVEEIYGDVINNKKTKKKELAFFKMADSYIFPTKELSKLVNTDSKPEVIIHGVYKSEDKSIKNNEILKYFPDNYIHCVYAGTLDYRKGCIISAESVKYLPSNFYVHILGEGNKDETDRLLKTINEVSNETTARISYDGCIYGDDFKSFLQHCSIGLCPQDPNASFTSTSFPSKILMYMSNGLSVVSIRIPSIEESKVGKLIEFYDNQNPKDLAKAIINDSNRKINYCDEINKLDVEFSRDIKKLIIG